MSTRTSVKHLASPKRAKTENEKLALGEMPVSNSEPKGRKCLGEIAGYNQRNDSYIVITRGDPGGGKAGGQQLRGVPRKVDNPGHVAPLALGTVVIVDFGLGFPYIDGTLNVDASRTIVENGPRKPKKFGGPNSVTSVDMTGDDNSPGYYRHPYVPDDAIAGDNALCTPDGNFVGALRGKESTMYGSEKAQVQCLGSKDLVRVVCEDYEHFSSFGELTIANYEGRAGLRFTGGADQLHESGGKENLPTFKIAIGDEGDFFDLSVLGEDGSTKAQIHISADGRLTLLGLNGVHLVNGGNSPSYEEVGSDTHRKVKGAVSEEIEGAVTKTLLSTKTEKISESSSTVIGHNETRTVNNHQIVSIGGRQEYTITGDSAVKANPLSIAGNINILNGSYVINVGDSLAGATPAAKAGYRIFVHNGEIMLGADPNPFTSTIAAYVSLNTTKPNSVALGGIADTLNPYYSKNPAVKHPVLFEPFSTFLTTLIALLDSHTHGTKFGPSDPSSAPSPGGFASALSSQIAGLPSIRVAIGA
jgi:hypothetical protein